jgi:hypothetical protein
MSSRQIAWPGAFAMIMTPSIRKLTFTAHVTASIDSMG